MTKSKQQTQEPSKSLDKRRRSDAAAIDHFDRRNLLEAFIHGARIGFPPTCTIDFHPAQMTTYPEIELAVWFKDELRNRITTWLRRRKIGWYAVWVRENYVGDRREHLHLMIHCPPRLRSDLDQAIRRWYPGDDKMVKLGALTWRRHPSGRVACAGFEYRLKQMTSTAQGPPRPIGRPRREVKSRHDGSPVAPVSGLRCGVSKTLDEEARESWMEMYGQQEGLAYQMRRLVLPKESREDT